MTAPAPLATDGSRAGRLYRMLWRWHFYAGLVCIPFIVVLAISGSVYLFRPQIENWIDRDLLRLERTGAPQSADAIVAAALATDPGARLAAIVLPEHPDQAARVIIGQDGARTRVYVHPDTLAILKTVGEEDRFRRVVFKIHGELLVGVPGTLLVELAASWAIVMILTGLYLWWPRTARGLGGVLYPRLGKGMRIFWRDIHAVTGVWISALALFLLVTGLPWALVWGESFKAVRAWTGTAGVQQDWSTSSAGEHAAHVAADRAPAPSLGGGLSIDDIVARAAALDLAPPVLVQPPDRTSPDWTVTSDAANRPLRADVWLSAATGEVTARQDFRERHILDRIVGYGVAAHEGQLFPPLNQALGILAAFGLVALCGSAVVLWRRRAPAGVLGAPPAIPDARIGGGLAAIIVTAGVLLPALGASLLLIAVLEWLLLRRWPSARRWLGLSVPHSERSNTAA